jgi:hypothetical protein
VDGLKFKPVCKAYMNLNAHKRELAELNRVLYDFYPSDLSSVLLVKPTKQ